MRRNRVKRKLVRVMLLLIRLSRCSGVVVM